jgi:hypothetical protein
MARRQMLLLPADTAQLLNDLKKGGEFKRVDKKGALVATAVKLSADGYAVIHQKGRIPLEDIEEVRVLASSSSSILFSQLLIADS